MNKRKSNRAISLVSLIVIFVVLIIIGIVGVKVLTKEKELVKNETPIVQEDLEIIVTDIAVVDTNGNILLKEQSIVSEKLYIQFKPILECGVIDSVAIGDVALTPELSGLYRYEVIENGIFEFVIRGTSKGKSYIKKESITVNQFSLTNVQNFLPAGLVEGTEFVMDTDNNEETKETWIVLHKTENAIEIISKNTMGSLTLGLNDSYINWNDKNVISNADLDNDGTLLDIEKTIYSYNNSIETLNGYCDSLIKNEDVRAASLGIRSVGSLPNDPSYKNLSRPVGIKNLNSWSNRTAWDIYGVFGEDGDENLNDDYNKMEKLGIKSCGEETSYWLASRRVYESWMDSNLSGSVSFQIRQMSSEYCISTYIWKVNNIGENQINITTTSAVRPVIKLKYP